MPQTDKMLHVKVVELLDILRCVYMAAISVERLSLSIEC